MVIPVIPIALAAAARFIAKKGIAAAIKKFGKKTVNEAKKHVKDVVTKPTAGQEGTKAGVRGMRNARQLGRQAALIGAGTGGTAVALALKEKLAKAKEAEEKAKTAEAKAKARADQEIINAAIAKAMLEDKESSAPETSQRPVTRKDEKVTRPKTRPKDLNMGGMAKAKPRTGNMDYRKGGMFTKSGNK